MCYHLRTPLTKLMLYIEILRSEKLADEEQRRDYLNRSVLLIGQIKELADNILQYSIQPKEDYIMTPEPMSFTAVLHDPLSEMAGYLSRRGYVLEYPQIGAPIRYLYMSRISCV